jgi:hypothetical protein
MLTLHFGSLLQLGEELRVKDVDLLLHVGWDDVVLQEAQIEQDKNVVQVDTRLEELEVLLADLHCAVQCSVSEFAHHLIFLQSFYFVGCKVA